MNLYPGKLFFLFILCVTIFASWHSRGQGWQWAKGTTNSRNFNDNDIATDTHGNVYYLGEVFNSVITLGSFTFPNPGGSCIVLVKYDSSGNVIWAKGIHGRGNMSDFLGGESVTVDAFNNIYISGWFCADTITFDNIHLYPGGGIGGGELFLAKYDEAGNIIWAKKSTSNKSVEPCSVNADAAGNVYVAGNFNGTMIQFGAIILSKPSAGRNDFFLVKYDSAGNALWAKRTDSFYTASASSSAIDASGNVYVTGDFYNRSVTFGHVTLVNSDTTSTLWPSATDVFIVKYDNAGNVLWARSGGGGAGSSNTPTSMATDNRGNAYVTGFCYDSSITFGTVTLDINTPDNSWNMFLVKYDSSGNALWVRGATGKNDPMDVATDDTGNIYVAGYYIRPITFGTTTLPIDNSDTSVRLFIVKYTPLGNPEWVRSANSNSCVAKSLAIDVWNNLYVAGVFQTNSVSFGSTTLIANVPDSNYQSVFLAKLIGSLWDNTQVPVIAPTVATIYPNPANNIITIVSTSLINNIAINNSIGQAFYHKEHNSQEVQIDVAELPSGIYLVRINGIEVRKFIKQ